MNNQGSNINQFSSNKYISGLREFLASSSLVAKFAFLLFVIFMYVLLLRVGIAIFGFFYETPQAQQFISGMVNGNQMLTFPQDPKIPSSKTTRRSQNEIDGIEFTWSVWLFIDPTTPFTSGYQHIFHKGNSDISTDTGLNFPNNAPGLYIMPNTNALAVIMNTYNSINEEITVEDIPLNKWVNVIIRCSNTKMDVYINGLIAKSIILNGVPKQNYGNVYVAMNNGFTGNISNLWYYNYALSIREIQQLTSSGPDTNASSSSNNSSSNSISDYLALRWYFQSN